MFVAATELCIVGEREGLGVRRVSPMLYYIIDQRVHGLPAYLESLLSEATSLMLPRHGLSAQNHPHSLSNWCENR